MPTFRPQVIVRLRSEEQFNAVQATAEAEGLSVNEWFCRLVEDHGGVSGVQVVSRGTSAMERTVETDDETERRVPSGKKAQRRKEADATRAAIIEPLKAVVLKAAATHDVANCRLDGCYTCAAIRGERKPGEKESAGELVAALQLPAQTSKPAHAPNCSCLMCCPTKGVK